MSANPTGFYREAGNQLRIISAREANKSEQKHYEGVVMRDNYDFSDSIPNPYAKMKTTPALPKKRYNQLTLKQKLKLLSWRFKS